MANLKEIGLKISKQTTWLKVNVSTVALNNIITFRSAVLTTSEYTEVSGCTGTLHYPSAVH